MSGFLLKTGAAALALVLSAGVGRAVGVDISGGSSADVGGWQIAPGPGVTLTGVSLDSSTNTLLIQNESETFSSGGTISVSFNQLDEDAASSIEFATATIQNSTGSDWNEFTFSVAGSAVFDGVGNVFAPPFSSGVNYSSVTLNVNHNLLTYTGTQSNGATSNWGSSNPGDDLLIDVSTTIPAIVTPSIAVPLANFSLDELPTAALQVVQIPSAAWLSLAGLVILGFRPLARKMATVHA